MVRTLAHPLVIFFFLLLLGEFNSFFPSSHCHFVSFFTFLRQSKRQTLLKNKWIDPMLS